MLALPKDNNLIDAQHSKGSQPDTPMDHNSELMSFLIDTPKANFCWLGILSLPCEIPTIWRVYINNLNLHQEWDWVTLLPSVIRQYTLIMQILTAKRAIQEQNWMMKRRKLYCYAQENMAEWWKASKENFFKYKPESMAALHVMQKPSKPSPWVI